MPPYLAGHDVADGDEEGVGELQDAEHLAGHDVQGQAGDGGQTPRAPLGQALGDWGRTGHPWGGGEAGGRGSPAWGSFCLPWVSVGCAGTTSKQYRRFSPWKRRGGAGV